MSPDTTHTRPNDNPNRPSDSSINQPLDAEGYAWPIISFDPVEKMKALAAALPYAATDEAVFDAPFEKFWSLFEDLETYTPRIEGGVTSLKILERNGDRLRLKARSPLRVWTHFNAILRPGFCVMQNRFGQTGMAARPESESRTRFFHFEGASLGGRIARPFLAWNIRQDFRRIRSILEEMN